MPVILVAVEGVGEVGEIRVGLAVAGVNHGVPERAPAPVFEGETIIFGRSPIIAPAPKQGRSS
jgi:hypothetical protein